MKHKHADLIKQWADGAEVQYQNIDGWHDIKNSSSDVTLNWRIKPEEKKPVVRWLWAYQSNPNGDWTTSHFYYTDKEMSYIDEKVVKLEWSRTEFPE